MNNKGVIALIIIGLIVVISVVYIILSLPKISDWNENLNTKLDEPYDLDFAERLLLEANKDKFKKLNSSDDLEEKLENINSNEKTTYFYLGNKYNLTTKECTALMNFVHNGNTAFISSRYWPNSNSLDSFIESTYKYLFDPLEPEFNEMSLPHGLESKLHGFEQSYVFEKYRPYTSEKADQSWSFFSPIASEDYGGIDQLEVIGENQLGDNFLKVKHGDGYFYLHCNPILFSNYFLIEENGYKYFQDVLTFIPEGDHLIYDDNSRYYKSEDPSRNRKKDFYPLEIIMQNRALYAFVITLALLFVVYILFNAKRKQRTIPLMPDNSNTSIEFSKTIGALYLQSGNNKKIVEKKMKMFKFFILSKYGIATANTNQQNLKIIAQKSGLALAFIKEIFKEYEIIMSKSNIESEELMSFHNRLEIFYNNTKR